MKQALLDIKEKALAQIEAATESLEEIRVGVLGKKGELTAILKQMGKLSAEERPVIGQLANQVRADIEAALAEKQEKLQAAALQKQLAAQGYKKPQEIFLAVCDENNQLTVFPIG